MISTNSGLATCIMYAVCNSERVAVCTYLLDIPTHVCFCVGIMPSCVPCMVYLEHLVGSKSLHAVIKHSVYVHYIKHMYIQESTTACGVR